MELTDQQKDLLSFVTEAHGEQVRKYTGEPYTVHLVEVADLVKEFAPSLFCGVEVALCHDLFEDTEVGHATLEKMLRYFDYTGYQAETICNAVYELTDQFTPERYPKLNRAKRKEFEAERYSRFSKLAKSVKLADLISNTRSIAAHDAKFARVYLQEKFIALEHLAGGEHSLYVLACGTYLDSIKIVNNLYQ